MYFIRMQYIVHIYLFCFFQITYSKAVSIDYNHILFQFTRSRQQISQNYCHRGYLDKSKEIISPSTESNVMHLRHCTKQESWSHASLDSIRTSFGESKVKIPYVNAKVVWISQAHPNSQREKKTNTSNLFFMSTMIFCNLSLLITRLDSIVHYRDAQAKRLRAITGNHLHGQPSLIATITKKGHFQKMEELCL